MNWLRLADGVALFSFSLSSCEYLPLNGKSLSCGACRDRTRTSGSAVLNDSTFTNAPNFLPIHMNQENNHFLRHFFMKAPQPTSKIMLRLGIYQVRAAPRSGRRRTNEVVVVCSGGVPQTRRRIWILPGRSSRRRRRRTTPLIRFLCASPRFLPTLQ
jgi:hypothetical protein